MGTGAKLLLGAILVLLLAGVGAVAGIINGGASNITRPTNDSLNLANEEVTRQVGERLDTALNGPATEPAVFVQLFSLEHVAGRSLPSGASLTQRAAFTRGVAEANTLDSNLLMALRNHAEAGDLITFRGIAQRDGHPVARFRQLIGTGGVNFIDLLIANFPDGPKVVDAFQLTFGRWQSEIVAEMFVQGVLNGPNAFERAMGERNPFIENAQSFQAMGLAANTGDYEGALRIYDSLPEDAQQTKAFFFLRINALSAIPDDPRYIPAVEEYVRLFPDDAGVRIRYFDIHYEQEQWEDALADLSAMERLFPDIYWNTIRADISMKQGDTERALELSEAVVAGDPSVLEGPDLALAASLALGRQDRAAVHAQTLRDTFGVNLALLASVPGYEGVLELPVPPPPQPTSPEETPDIPSQEVAP